MIATRQQTAVDLGMERLHPSVHHLRKSGDLLDADHRDAFAPQRLGGAAGGHDFPAQGDQRAGELDDAALVRYREERSHQISAVAWTRSARPTRSRRSMTSAGECE